LKRCTVQDDDAFRHDHVAFLPRDFDMAKSVGKSLTEPTIFFLEGNLGAGKTVFAKGLICGLGQADPDDVPSPSFTLINEYDLRLKAYHIDLYRLETREICGPWIWKRFLRKPAVILVEWAEKLGNPDLPVRQGED
jgi:tRNA threonylcarbamoyladenosine biosynthesis protein TsaE